MAKTSAERMEELVEAMQKLTDTDERLVKVQEKRLSDLKKTERKLESFEDLGKQLRESLLAPLQGIARMIPAPLRILGKMAIAPIVKPFLRSSMETQTAAAAAAGGGPVRHDAFSEAMGREMSQKGYYKGMAASTMAKIPGMGSLAEKWSDKGGVRGRLSGWMGMSTGEPGDSGGMGWPVSRRNTLTFIKWGTQFFRMGVKKGSVFVRDEESHKKLDKLIQFLKPIDPSKANVSRILGADGEPIDLSEKAKDEDVKVKFPLLKFLALTKLFDIIWPWIKALGLPAAALLVLRGLGLGALGGAVIIWGLWAAWQSISDLITGWKEGGLDGAISKFLTGEGEGILNAVKTAAKIGAIGAFAGFYALGPPGAVAGAIVGMAIGGILGYFGKERIEGWATDISTNLSKMFNWDSAPGWLRGATLGGTLSMIGLIAALGLGAAVSWPVALALLLGGMAIGGLTNVAKDMLADKKSTDDAVSELTDYAKDAQVSWIDRHIYGPIRAAISSVFSDGAARHTDAHALRMRRLGPKIDELAAQRHEALTKDVQKPLNENPAWKNWQDQRMRSLNGNGPHHGSTQGKEGEDWYIDENGVFTIIINTGKKSSKRSGPSTRTGENPIESVIKNSEPHLVTDVGLMIQKDPLGWNKLFDFGGWLHRILTPGNLSGSDLNPITNANQKVWEAIKNETGIEGTGNQTGFLITPVNTLNTMIGGGGGVDFNSMANVNTTNISQAKTRDVGLALAFTKTKNSRLGYAVS